MSIGRGERPGAPGRSNKNGFMTSSTRRRAFIAAAAAFTAAAPRFAGAQGLTKVRLSGSPDHDIIGAL